MCKVSVIVPVYRVEKYVDRCMKSLLRQTLTDIEVVCICEKEDSSYQKLFAYQQADARVHLVEKKNTGVSSARNAGMRAAKGKYLAFVDADDWIERYALETLYLTAEQYDTQIIAYGIWPTVEPGSDRRGIFDCTPVRNVLYHGNGMKALFYEHGSRPYIGNKFYNRQFLAENDIWFNESMRLGEDQLLQFEAFGKAENICFVKDKLYHYDIKRNDSAMNGCRQQDAETDSFRLLTIIMDKKREQYPDAYDKEYTAWLLQEYGRFVNQHMQSASEDRMNKIRSISGYFQELSAGKYVHELPLEYQYLYERFEKYREGGWNDAYIRLPYREYDAFMKKQTEGLCQKIMTAERCFIGVRRLYEIFVFHEIWHWILTGMIRLVQRYKIYRARKIKIPS